MNQLLTGGCGSDSNSLGFFFFGVVCVRVTIVDHLPPPCPHISFSHTNFLHALLPCIHAYQAALFFLPFIFSPFVWCPYSHLYTPSITFIAASEHAFLYSSSSLDWHRVGTAQVGVIVKPGKILLFSSNSDCLLPLFGHHCYVQLVRHHQFDLLTLEVPQDHPRGHRSSCILCPLLGYDAPCTVCPACRSISAQTAPRVLPYCSISCAWSFFLHCHDLCICAVQLCPAIFNIWMNPALHLSSENYPDN